MDRMCTLHLPRPSIMQVGADRIVLRLKMSQADVLAAMRELADCIETEPDWQAQFKEETDHG